MTPSLWLRQQGATEEKDVEALVEAARPKVLSEAEKADGKMEDELQDGRGEATKDVGESRRLSRAQLKERPADFVKGLLDDGDENAKDRPGRRRSTDLGGAPKLPQGLPRATPLPPSGAGASRNDGLDAFSSSTNLMPLKIANAGKAKSASGDVTATSVESLESPLGDDMTAGDSPRLTARPGLQKENSDLLSARLSARDNNAAKAPAAQPPKKEPPPLGMGTKRDPPPLGTGTTTKRLGLVQQCQMIKEKLKLPAELAPPRVLEQANEILGLKGEGALPAQATLALKTIEDNQKAKAELLRKQAEERAAAPMSSSNPSSLRDLPSFLGSDKSGMLKLPLGSTEFPCGTPVLCKRSTGEESIGYVQAWDEKEDVYTLELNFRGSGIRKLAARQMITACPIDDPRLNQGEEDDPDEVTA